MQGVDLDIGAHFDFRDTSANKSNARDVLT